MEVDYEALNCSQHIEEDSLPPQDSKLRIPVCEANALATHAATNNFMQKNCRYTRNHLHYNF